MTTEQILWTVFSSLMSGLLGVGISTHYYKRHENRRWKMDTLKRFMANRYDLVGDEFSRALNEIFIVYSDSNLVMESLAKHHKAVTTPGINSEDELLKLLKAMCKEVDVNYKEINDSFFLCPYNTRATRQNP